MIATPGSLVGQPSRADTELPARGSNGAAVRPAGVRRKAVITALRLLAGVALIGLILGRVDLDGIGDVRGGGALLGVAVAVPLLLAAQALSAVRWRAILGAGTLSWGYLFRLYLIGQFFSLFLPTSVGGDAVRTVAAARALPRPGEAISSVLLDRVFGVVALGVYLLLGVAVAPASLAGVRDSLRLDVPLGAVSVVLLAVAAAVALFARFRRRLPKLEAVATDSWRVALALARSPSALARVSVLALLVQAIYIAVWLALAAGLGFRLPLAFFLFAVPLVSLVAMLPVTFSGLGLREGAWVLLLAPFDIPAAHAVAFGLLYFLAFLALGALGGLCFLVRGTEPTRKTMPRNDLPPRSS